LSNKALVLIGGGHAHVEVLRRLAETPAAESDIALFDPSPSVWYSGMLPGVIAGHYQPSEAKINLWALCQRARVRFFETSVLAIHGDNQRIESGFGERHRFDFASVDVGSVSKTLPTSPGAYVVAVKPIEPLLAAIHEFESVRSSALMVRVVGGGAAALEVALALAWRWRDSRNRRVSIVSAVQLMHGFPPRVRRLAIAACRRHAVEVIENAPVEQIEPTRLRLGNGGSVDTQLTVLATGYSPAPLLAKAALTRSSDGSISVNEHLQDPKHPNVFAAGDCASVGGFALPKSGVYAVRQGPLLATNLLAALKNEPLQTYKHDPNALNLLSLGDKRAIATRNGLAISGGWVWRWKDSIDRKWMRKYALE
jgi:selenide,water dikinase